MPIGDLYRCHVTYSCQIANVKLDILIRDIEGSKSSAVKGQGFLEIFTGADLSLTLCAISFTVGQTNLMYL